jgi:bis(5'-nucleosidyl)-tetraphosphatase
MLTEHSAGAIIFKKEGGEVLFLILHYEEGHWGASKGHIEKGENPEQTARREIREETGLENLQFIPGFQMDSSYVYSKDRQLSRKTVTFFLAESLSREVELSDEHVDYNWLPFREALAKVTFKGEKEVWQAANRYRLECSGSQT